MKHSRRIWACTLFLSATVAGGVGLADESQPIAKNEVSDIISMLRKEQAVKGKTPERSSSGILAKPSAPRSILTPPPSTSPNVVNTPTLPGRPTPPATSAAAVTPAAVAPATVPAQAPTNLRPQVIPPKAGATEASTGSSELARILAEARAKAGTSGNAPDVRSGLTVPRIPVGIPSSPLETVPPKRTPTAASVTAPPISTPPAAASMPPVASPSNPLATGQKRPQTPTLPSPGELASPKAPSNSVLDRIRNPGTRPVASPPATPVDVTAATVAPDSANASSTPRLDIPIIGEAPSASSAKPSATGLPSPASGYADKNSGDMFTDDEFKKLTSRLNQQLRELGVEPKNNRSASPAKAPKPTSSSPFGNNLLASVANASRDMGQQVGTQALSANRGPTRPGRARDANTAASRPVGPDRSRLDQLQASLRDDALAAAARPGNKGLSDSAWESAPPTAWRYDGQWLNGQMHGDGKLEYRDGWTYEGGFIKGTLDGEGTLSYPDGTVFTGQFRDGVMSGPGTLRFTDGLQFIGSWKDGRIDGSGSIMNLGQ